MSNKNPRLRKKQIVAGVFTTAIVIAATLLGGGIAQAEPRNAATAGATAAISEAPPVHVIVPFSSATTLTQAESIARSRTEPTVGFRFDNGQVVGEYFTARQSATDFKRAFRDLYGTDPQVVGLIVNRPKPTGGEKAKAKLHVAEVTIQTGLPAFQAKPVPAEKAAALSSKRLRTTSARPEARPMSNSRNWMPDSVYSATHRVGSSQYFSTIVDWFTTSPGNIDTRFGMEIGIDLYNGATGTRGSVVPGQICGPNFRDKFIAKNYNWHSWSVGASPHWVALFWRPGSALLRMW